MEIIALYKYLLPFAPAFSNKKLKKEIVFTSLSKDQSGSPNRVSVWMNGLFKLLEAFLSLEQFNQDHWQQDHHLILKYQDLKLPEAAMKRLEKAFRRLESEKYKEIDFHKQFYLLSKTGYDLSDKNKYTQNQELQKTGDSLDAFYIIEKLRYCIAMLTLKSIVNVNFDLGLGSKLSFLLDEQSIAQNPVIAVYLHIFKMLNEPEDSSHFHKTKQLLLKHAAIFSKDELTDLYSSILNYCIQKINRFNDERYWTEYLEINKALLKNGLLLEQGELSPWRYTNLVNVGLKTDQIEWTREFLLKYKEVLPKDYQEHMFEYNSGILHYHLKEYDLAQQLAFNLEAKDLLLNILNRSLLIKIYYETEQTELLLFSLEANRVFLIRNKLIDLKLKTQMKHFVEFTRKLAKIDKVDADKLPALKESLPEPSEVMHHEWLLIQIDKKMKTFLT